MALRSGSLECVTAAVSATAMLAVLATACAGGGWERTLAAYEKLPPEKALVLGINPEYGEFFHIIGRSAVREHRYKEAIELEKQAVAIAPSYWDAMEAIGTGLLRLGSEKEGIEWLEKAWAGDQYNLRTKNTLDLYVEDPGERSSTGIIPKHYSFLPSKHFKLRYPNSEKEVLHRYIAPLLDRAFEHIIGRWARGELEPIEGVESLDDFSVRVRRGIETIAKQHGRGARVAAVTSGGVIGVALSLALGFTSTRVLEAGRMVRNASISEFAYRSSDFAWRPGDFSLVGFNHVQHLGIVQVGSAQLVDPVAGQCVRT